MSALAQALADYLTMRRALVTSWTRLKDGSVSSSPSSKIAAKTI